MDVLEGRLKRMGAGLALVRSPTFLGLMLPLAAVALLGAILIGFATGAEMDVVTFVAARTFGTRVFTSIYVLFTSVLAISASLGPLLAGFRLAGHCQSKAPPGRMTGRGNGASDPAGPVIRTSRCLPRRSGGGCRG